MNRQILYAAFATIVFFTGLLLWLGRREEPKPIDHSYSPPTSQLPHTPPSVRVSAKEEISVWKRTEATLYGKVLDLAGNPVLEAKVIYDRPRTYYPDEMIKENGGFVKTDKMGNFALVRLPMAAVLMIRVEADGYDGTSEALKVFHFAGIPASISQNLPKGAVVPTVHEPDSANPVIFRMKKKGPTDPLYLLNASPDLGPPVTLSLEHEPSVKPPGEHCLLITGEVDKSSARTDPATEKELYNWNVEISVPGGGLAPRMEKDSLTAPLEGYVEKVLIDQKAEAGPQLWREYEDREYFVKFSDGTFGLVSIKCHPTMRGRSNVGVTSYFNPGGGRSMEYDKSKALKLKTK